MTSPGSDCPTGKRQFATKEAAAGVAGRARAVRGMTMRAYRCSLCGCFHMGNRRSQNSKGRTRR